MKKKQFVQMSLLTACQLQNDEPVHAAFLFYENSFLHKKSPCHCCELKVCV